MLVPGDSWKIEPGSFIWKNALRDCCTWSQHACQAKRHLAGTSIAAGLMHSVFSRTNNDNGFAAALLNGELYRVGILIAMVVLIAALALVAGCRRLSRAYRLELDTKPGETARSRTNSSTQQSGSVMTS
jgi:hypothetical protein